MDLAGLRAAVRNRMGNPADDALFTDAVVTGLLNAALHYIETEHDWGWLEAVETINTVAADPDYAPAATYARTISLHAPSGFPLRQVDLEELELLRDASGPPKLFGVIGALIELAPVPSGIQALRHRFIRTEADLAADADTPLIPARWHFAVVDYAANLGYRREGNLQEAGAALASYETWLEQMLREASRYSPSTGGGEPTPAPAQEESARGRR